HLRIEREILAEAMFPIEREAEKPEVEFPGFVFVEDAQNRRGSFKSYCRSAATLADRGRQLVPASAAEFRGYDFKRLGMRYFHSLPIECGPEGRCHDLSVE